jgi:hypothetical protein
MSAYLLSKIKVDTTLAELRDRWENPITNGAQQVMQAQLRADGFKPGGNNVTNTMAGWNRSEQS